jgi:hypothetical protein
MYADAVLSLTGYACNGARCIRGSDGKRTKCENHNNDERLQAGHGAWSDGCISDPSDRSAAQSPYDWPLRRRIARAPLLPQLRHPTLPGLWLRISRARLVSPLASVRSGIRRPDPPHRMHCARRSACVPAAPAAIPCRRATPPSAPSSDPPRSLLNLAGRPWSRCRSERFLCWATSASKVVCPSLWEAIHLDNSLTHKSESLKTQRQLHTPLRASRAALQVARCQDRFESATLLDRQLPLG